MTVSVQAALQHARQQIDRLDARLLLEYATGYSHTELLMFPERLLPTPAWEQFLSWVDRRAAGEPLAYLVGESVFRGRVYQVSPAVLIPRGDTEVLVEQGLYWLNILAKHRPQPLQALDLGTGSGIVALSLALEYPGIQMTAVDLSPEALRLARTNAGRLGAHLELLQGNWFSPLQGRRFDLIVSNPPYIAAGDPHLSRDGLPFEPAMALTDGVAGGTGIGCLEEIITAAPDHLHPGGTLLLEHGYDQGEACRNLLLAAGLQAAFTAKDLSGHDRVSGAQRPSS